MPAAVDTSRRIIIASICLGVGALHVLTGPGYGGPFPHFVNGYLIDVLLPSAMYLLLGIPGYPLLRGPAVRAALVFAVGAGTESLQYAGVNVFGSTYDPLDYLMFAVGIGLGILFERTVLDRYCAPGPGRDVKP